MELRFNRVKLRIKTFNTKIHNYPKRQRFGEVLVKNIENFDHIPPFSLVVACEVAV